MKILRLIALPFVLIVLFSHYLGLLFAISLIAAVIAKWGFGVPAAVIYLSVGWKVYVGLGVFTFAFSTTMSFQNCCVGIQRFGAHLKHHGFRGIAEDIVTSIVWPWYWFQLDDLLKGWYYSSFPDALFGALKYWFVDAWRGTTLTYIDFQADFQAGEVTTTRVRTAEEVRAELREILTRDLA